MTARIGAFCATLALALASLAAGAQAQQNTRIRGVVVSLAGQTLVVKTREGSEATIRLADDWTVGGLRPAALDDVKTGSFIGTAAQPQPDGSLRALEVLLFPPGVSPFEGHFPWDLMPESTMTNATVAEAVQGVNGRTLKLTYKGGEKLVTVPPETPIVAPASAEKSDVKAGAGVFIGAQRQTDGSLTAARVTIGNNGVAPPM